MYHSVHKYKDRLGIKMNERPGCVVFTFSDICFCFGTSIMNNELVFDVASMPH